MFNYCHQQPTSHFLSSLPQTKIRISFLSITIIIKFLTVVIMRQQQIQLQFLQQQHLRRLMQLQRERFMLSADNPFKKQSNNQIPMTLPYQANPTIEKLLYSTAQKDIKKRHVYIPREIDGKIAERSIQTILDNWHNQAKYFPDTALLRSIKRQQEQMIFQSQLSDIGRQQMEQILQQSRDLRQMRAKSTLRQKYENRIREQEYGRRLHQ